MKKFLLAIGVFVLSGACFAQGTSTGGGSTGGGSGGGSVTSVSAGSLSPLFTTAVATSTTTPAITFTANAAVGPNLVLAGPSSGGSGTYTFRALVTADIPSQSFPLTVAGTVNSGGIPCFTAATTESSSAAIAAGILIKGGGAGACAAASSVTDNGTTISSTESASFGASVSTTADGVHPSQLNFVGNTTAQAAGSNTFGIQGPNAATFTAYNWQVASAAPGGSSFMLLGAPSAGVSQLTYSAAGTNAAESLGISDTTFTNATTSISGNSCSASAVTVTLTGLTTSMALMITPSADVSGSAGWGSTGGLVIDAWPSSSNTMSYKICNQTSGSITPGAITWNVGAR